MTALEIINNWIDYSSKQRMKPHSKHFWNARDIIEGNDFGFSKEKKKKTIEFIKSLDESEPRNIIIKALEGK